MNNKESQFKIMLRLVKLVRPLAPIMTLGITLGALGHLAAIFVSIIAMKAVANFIEIGQVQGQALLALLIVAIARGILHYGEQYCNHYIAFRLLALIRHKVFSALRKLCPAKLEDKNRGDLITIITTDIELLEVFYAHTISPIAIAILVSLVMIIFIGRQNALVGIVAAIGYFLVGVIIPLINSKLSSDTGLKFRNDFSDLNSFALSNVYGVDEVLQYNCANSRLDQFSDKSIKLASVQKKLSDFEKHQKTWTNLIIQLSGAVSLGIMAAQMIRGQASFSEMLISVTAVIGSFGPVVAISSLSNNLNQTLACGKRVLDILDEEPKVYEQTAGADCSFSVNADEVVKVSNISFGYHKKKVLNDLSLTIKKGQITGIHAASGKGKSTLLRLLMRFWDVDEGAIFYKDANLADINIKEINTSSLRNNQSFVTQDTWIFHDSILNNIKLAKLDATRDEVIAAAKKASLDEFIQGLPQGYDTIIGEAGSTLSGGERQRIGIARAFLHGADLMLLDEPTSSLDSLNEGIILKALNEEAKDKTVVMVSHRKSTMGVCRQIIDL